MIRSKVKQTKNGNKSDKSKVRAMQNFHNIFFDDIYTWLDRAHCFT